MNYIYGTQYSTGTLPMKAIVDYIFNIIDTRFINMRGFSDADDGKILVVQLQVSDQEAL